MKKRIQTYSLIPGSLLFLVMLLYGSSLAGNFKQDYESAYNAYQKARSKTEFMSAADRFRVLSERDDAGQYRANTLYWLAECYYDLKDYVQALNNFERVLLFPQSNKEEAARYKVAVCYARLGWNKAAKWELSRFLRDYPESTLAEKARKELHQIK